MELGKRLRSRGYRLTPQRGAVFDVLSENTGIPLDAEAICRLAKEKAPGVGLATVYRSLELFVRLGVAQEVHLHEGSNYYEVDTGSHHHYMVCVSCGSKKVLEACTIDKLEDLVKDESDFLVTSHCLGLWGYCPSCLPSRA
jgi:Fur family transcriptional regulator, ferric uptake regulator